MRTAAENTNSRTGFPVRLLLLLVCVCMPTADADPDAAKWKREHKRGICNIIYENDVY